MGAALFDLTKDLKIYKSKEYDILVEEVGKLNKNSEEVYSLELKKMKVPGKVALEKTIDAKSYLTRFPINFYVTGWPYAGLRIKNTVKESIDFFDSLGLFGEVSTIGNLGSNLLQACVCEYLKRTISIKILIKTEESDLVFKLNASYSTDNFFGESRDFYNGTFHGPWYGDKSVKKDEEMFIKGFYLEEENSFVFKNIKLPKKLARKIKSISLLIPSDVVERVIKENNPKTVIFNYFLSKDSILKNIISGNLMMTGGTFSPQAQKRILDYIIKGRFNEFDSNYYGEGSATVEYYTPVDYGIRSVEEAVRLIKIIKEICVIFSFMKFPDKDYFNEYIFSNNINLKINIGCFLKGDSFKKMKEMNKLKPFKNEKDKKIYLDFFKKEITSRIDSIDALIFDGDGEKNRSVGDFEYFFNSIIKHLRVI